MPAVVAHRPRLARRGGRALPRGTQGRREAHRRLRGLRRRRPARPDEGVRPPHAPRRVERGLREPDQALVARLPRGLLLQAARRLGAPRATREGHRRALGLPLGPRLACALRGAAEGRRRRPRPARPDLRTRLDVRRAPERRPRRAAGGQPAADRARRGDGPPAGRDRGRPLPRRRRRVRARGASLHPVRRHAQEPGPLALRHERVLLQDARGDGGRLPGPRGRARRGRSRSRSAARSSSSSGASSCRRSRSPRGATRSTTSSSSASRVSSGATGRRHRS